MLLNWVGTRPHRSIRGTRRFCGYRETMNPRRPGTAPLRRVAAVALAAVLGAPGAQGQLCEPLAGDLDGDRVVAVSDLLLMLGALGPCPPCLADLDGDGTVDVNDYLILIANWGLSDAPGDLDGNGSVGSEDFLILLSHWGPCPACTGDLDGDGAVTVLDLLMLLGQLSTPGPPDDRYFLYQDLVISVFDGSGGLPTFTAVRPGDGALLREAFDDETFFVDHSGGTLDIGYDIIEQCGGVDVVYTIANPTATERTIPDFRIDGFLHAEGDTVEYLNPKDSGTMEPVAPDATLLINRNYPGTYSPVIVTRDESSAVGTALLYPYLDYRHPMRVRLSPVAGGLQAGTWRHRYEVNDPALIAPGETRTYTVSVRFAERRYWILTLHPYKTFFQQTYGGGAPGPPPDRRPIYKVNVSNRGDYDPDTNPRGYNENLLIHTPAGWEPLVTGVIDTMVDAGLERFHLWLASGTYHVPNGCNFPPQFMDFLPHLEETDVFFELFGQHGFELGFWWGRSTQIPLGLDGSGWDPQSCAPADYFNPDHIAFLDGQLQQALGRGAAAVGLDAFVHMPPWQRALWVEDMKDAAPGVLFIHEGSGPDFLHRAIGNYYAPHRWGRVIQPGPDLLTRYLGNGSSAIWVAFRRPNSGEYADYVYTHEDMQQQVSWGFAPILQGTIDQFDVPSLDYTLVQCFDGLDNDGDGLADFPYDPDCESAADGSE